MTKAQTKDHNSFDMLNPEQSRFGSKTVTPEEKTKMVRGVFDSVAEKYDIMNDFMSGGMHRLWKDRFVRMIRPRAGQKFLDVAGGTGDIAFRIRKKTSTDTAITICDLDEQMLRVGRDRAHDKGLFHNFDWVTGNAEHLPFPDNSFDIYTIAFGLRNVTHIDTALKEACRVLKPGGRFFCLEFSQVQEPFLAKAYDEYSFRVIPTIGEIVAKDRESYQYLVESIRAFPKAKDLQKRMIAAGFKRASFERLTFGVVAVHKGIVG